MPWCPGAFKRCESSIARLHFAESTASEQVLMVRLGAAGLGLAGVMKIVHELLQELFRSHARPFATAFVESAGGV
jgi:hypothetical protein